MAEAQANLAAPTDTEPVVIFKKRGAFAKGNIRKRPAEPVLSQSQSDNDSSDGYSENESGGKVKRRKKISGVVTSSSVLNKSSDQELTASKFVADRNAAITSSNDATKETNWFDLQSNDALSSKNLPATVPNVSQMPDGIYKGLANQTDFIQKNPDAPTRSVGPIKAPSNVRTITVTDYSPDVCKDYKTTGFCGFGDNCKYLHDRSDYKAGWQLDREWEIVTKGKKIGGTVVASASRSKADEEDGDEGVEEDIPFACVICKGPYRDPIVTKCGHYFCESCALQRYRKDPSCAICGSGTNGVFNNAKKLKGILDARRQRAALEEEDESD